MILREGRLLLAVLGAGAVAAHVAAGWAGSLPVLALAALVAYLYRDPDRDVPSVPLGVVSPADGTVESIERRPDPFLDRDALCIRLRMGLLDGYSTRSPVEGRIVQRWYSAGDAAEVRARRGRLRYALWIQTDEQDDVVLSMLRESSWRAPLCYVHAGERVGQGQRCGMIRFGSAVELYLPFDARSAVQAGDHLRAGADLVATLTHKASPRPAHPRS